MIAQGHLITERVKPGCQVCGRKVPQGHKVNCSRLCTIRAADRRRKGVSIEDSAQKRKPLRRPHVTGLASMVAKLKRRLAVVRNASRYADYADALLMAIGSVEWAEDERLAIRTMRPKA